MFNPGAYAEGGGLLGFRNTPPPPQMGLVLFVFSRLLVRNVGVWKIDTPLFFLLLFFCFLGELGCC